MTMRTTFTNKQMWRRQPTGGIRRHNVYDLVFDEYQKKDGPIVQSISENSFLEPHSVKFNHKTEDKPVSFPKITKSPSRVRFNPSVHVVLIPTVAEYRQAGLGCALWWEESDYCNFKKDAIQEMLKHMLAHPSLNSKEVIRVLYQPDEEGKKEEAPKEFERPRPVSLPVGAHTAGGSSIVHLDAHSHSHLSPLLPIKTEHVFCACTLSPERPPSTRHSVASDTSSVTSVAKSTDTVVLVDSVIDDLGPADHHTLRRCDTSFFNTPADTATRNSTTSNDSSATSTDSDITEAALATMSETSDDDDENSSENVYSYRSNSLDTVDLAKPAQLAPQIQCDRKGLSHLLKDKKFLPFVLKV